MTSQAILFVIDLVKRRPLSSKGVGIDRAITRCDSIVSLTSIVTGNEYSLRRSYKTGRVAGTRRAMTISAPRTGSRTVPGTSNCNLHSRCTRLYTSTLSAR